MAINRRARNRRLPHLGFQSYAEYLKSDVWKDIRDRAFAENGSDCVCCGASATQVHHTRYQMQELNGTNLKHLQPICRSCHYKIEFKEDGKKRTGRGTKYEFTKLFRRRQAMLARLANVTIM